jgi:hypothetical protein
VRVQKAFANGIRVLVGIGISVMSTVVSRPPSDRALDGSATNGCEEDPEGKGCAIGAMSPKSVVTCR